MLQDRPLELAESRAGLDPELVLERDTALAEYLERLGLAAGPVERRHQLRPQPLAERVLRDELA